MVNNRLAPSEQEAYISNNPWGDLLREKTAEEPILRLYFININGYQLDSHGGKLREILSVCDKLDIDVLGIAEHNCDSLQYSVRQTVYDTHKRLFRHSKSLMSTSTIRSHTKYKPGGTSLSCLNNVVGRITQTEKDIMGRWCTTTLIGRNFNLSIMAAYQVPHETGHAGPHTAYTQQLSTILQQAQIGDSSPTPRQKFISDLDQWLNAHISLNEEIIIMGDFNESTLDSRMGIKGLIQKHGLVDIMAVMHPEMRPPSTYQRGKRRLDYALGTAGIVDYITKCGYDPFNERVTSDHRGFFIDINSHALSMTANPMCTSRTRKLRTGDDALTMKYIKQKHEYLTRHNVFERLRELETTQFDQSKLDAIDRDVLRGSLQAEKTLLKRKGPGLWSVQLDSIRKKIRLLYLYLSKFRTRRDFTLQIAELQSHLDNFEAPTTKEECLMQLRHSKREIKEILRDDYDIRLAELHAKAEKEHARNPNSDLAKILRRMIRAAETEQVFNKLRLIRGKNLQNNVMQRIDVLDTEGNWTPMTDAAKIEKTIQDHNKLHFRQAKGTPWTEPPLGNNTNYEGTTESAHQILQGNYRHLIPSTDPNGTTAKVLESMAYASPELATASPISEVLVSDEEFSSKLKHWKESTSTSPSGLHLGHYKMLITPIPPPSEPPPENQQTEDEPTLESLQLDLRMTHLSLLNLCITNATTLPRWHTVASVMIEKDKGSPKITRLRVIHLFEADYNLLLGLRWKELIRKAVHRGYLNENQHAVPKSNSIIPVLLEETQYEYCRLTREKLIRFDNDAKACYDRIVPNMSTICNLRLGLHPHLARIHGQALTSMKYYLKTPTGLSDMYYYHDPPDWPVLGTGQGAGNSPACWSGVSSVLFDCHDKHATAAHFSTSDKVVQAKIGITGYVDDSTLSTTAQSTAALFAQAQYDAQLWHDFLWNSGGTLSLSKCSYHYIDFGFYPSGEPYMQDENAHKIILFSYDRTQEVEITGLRSTESHRTLGCYKSPNGSQATQTDILRDKCQHYATVVAQSRLTQREAATFYGSIFVPSVGYALPTCHFRHKELHTLQAKAHSEIFAANGYNRHFPHSVIFAPKAWGGGGFHHFYDLQGLGQLKHFMSAIRQPQTQLGTMIRICLERLQRHAGIGESVFYDTSTPLPHVPSKWFLSFREYLQASQLKLSLTDTYVTPLQREHDYHIMGRILEHGAFTPGQLRRINYCRLFLNVEMVSDICLADGETLDSSFMKGTPSILSSRSTNSAIHQITPDATSWRLWRKAIRYWSHRGKLVHPLGQWCIPFHERIRLWPAYYNVTRKSLAVYHPADSCYQIYAMSTTYITFPSPTKKATKLDSSYVPVDITATEDGWRISTSSFTVAVHTQATIALTPDTGYSFSTYLLQQPSWAQDLLQGLSLHIPITVLPELLPENMLASDGSYYESTNTGTFGWVIGNPDAYIVECTGHALPSHHGSSYRSEASGMLSLLLFLHHAASFLGLSDAPDLLLLCDNKGLVQTTRNCRHRLLQPLQSDWDIIREIQILLQSPFLLGIQPKHVKSHADRTLPRDEWTPEQHMNIRADELAGPASAPVPPTGAQRYSPLMSATTVHLQSSDMQATITGRVTRTAQQCRTVPPFLSYLCQRWRWEQLVVNTIDWPSYRTAQRRTVLSRRVTPPTFCKLACRLLPLGLRLHRVEPHRSPNCPACGELETDEHLPICQDPSRVHWRQGFLKELDLFLADPQGRHNICPELSVMLREGITLFLQRSEVFPCPLTSDVNLAVWQEQTAIGWYNIFPGHMTSKWKQQQQQYLDTHPCDRKPAPTATAWMTSLLHLFHRHWSELWEIRNKTVHGADPQTSTTQMQKLLWSRVRAVEALSSLLDPTLRTLLERVKLQPSATTSVLHQWLHSYESLFQSQASAYQKASVHQMKPLTHYFQRTTPSVPS